jgi:hypothetical protein
MQVSNYQIKNQTRNIQIDKSSKKLDYKMLESFKILEKKEISYTLDLFDEINMIIYSRTS